MDMARKKRLVVMVEPSTHEALRLEAMNRRISLGACVREALSEYRKLTAPPSRSRKPQIPWQPYTLPDRLIRLRGLLAGTNALEDWEEAHRREARERDRKLGV